MERQYQFIRDFRLLLKKYHTERALAEVMAKSVSGSIETYYSIFLRYIIDPNRLNANFIEEFYKIFADDFDALRGRDVESVPTFLKDDMKGKTIFEMIELQKEAYVSLQGDMDRLIESYHTMVLGYKRSVHQYYQLLEYYEDALRKLNDESNESPE
jgi:hypothetical protein